MRVVRSGHFERQVAAELDIEGRPSVRQFDDQLAPIAELVFSAFWDDPTLVPAVDEESGIRITLIAPPKPTKREIVQPQRISSIGKLWVTSAPSAEICIELPTWTPASPSMTFGWTTTRAPSG